MAQVCMPKLFFFYSGTIFRARGVVCHGKKIVKNNFWAIWTSGQLSWLWWKAESPTTKFCSGGTSYVWGGLFYGPIVTGVAGNRENDTYFVADLWWG